MNGQTQVGMPNTANRGRYLNYDTTRCHFTLDDARRELQREANVRMKCYDRWIRDGKMTEAEASLRMGSLVSAWHFLADTEQGKQMLASNQRIIVPETSDAGTDDVPF